MTITIDIKFENGESIGFADSDRSYYLLPDKLLEMDKTLGWCYKCEDFTWVECIRKKEELQEIMNHKNEKLYYRELISFVERRKKPPVCLRCSERNIEPFHDLFGIRKHPVKNENIKIYRSGRCYIREFVIGYHTSEGERLYLSDKDKQKLKSLTFISKNSSEEGSDVYHRIKELRSEISLE